MTNGKSKENDDDPPVYQYTTAILDGTLDKSIAFWEMLEQVFVLYVVHFNSHVLEAIKEALLDRQLQHRKYMCDFSFSKRFFPTKSKQSASPSGSHSLGGVCRWTLANTGLCHGNSQLNEYAPTDVEVQFP
jgi:hypothetical protein